MLGENAPEWTVTPLLARVRRLLPRLTRRSTDAALAGQVLLLATGVIVVVTAPLQTLSPAVWEVVGVVTVAMLAVLGASLLVPWPELPVRAVLAFPLVLMVAITVLSVEGRDLGFGYIGLYVLAFVYIGLFTPPRTSWWLLPFGVLAYGPTSGGWSAALVVRLLVVATVWVLIGELLAALMQQQAAAMSVLSRASRADELTALDNRRGLAARLGTTRDGDVVVMCDLDHFKRVNDTRGHAFGDRVLADFGALLTCELRRGDYAARYGGEEFILLLSATTSHGLSEVLKRLHAKWALVHPDITFSSGACVHRGDRDVQLTIAAADRALYAAKQAGRDRDHTDDAEVTALPALGAPADEPAPLAVS